MQINENTERNQNTPYYIATYDTERGIVWYLQELSLIHIVKLSDAFVYVQ